ncbi:MAG: hypothetical protein O6934_12520 [SAR324 cluster bacterium]|nr:hypothetical protein [SAR324 cluster bacterium]
MAARTFKLISVSPLAVEGVGISRGAQGIAVSFTHLLPPVETDPLVNMLQQFDRQLEDAGWKDSPATLVFPCDAVSIRRLEFPFREQKKIDQALEFELDNELLEDVGDFTYKHTVVPHEDGTAVVLVYLISNDYLQSFLNLFQNRRLTPVKATFSAQALLEINPPPSDRHYQVYLGLDEIFVSSVLDNQLYAIKSFPLRLTGLTDNGGAPRPDSAAQILEMLNAQESPPDEGAEAAQGSRGVWDADLSRLAGEIMQFILPHSQGAPFTLSLHGLLAPYFEWDSSSLELTMRAPGSTRVDFGRASMLGILNEIMANPLPFTSSKGVNFFTNRGSLLPHFKEFRRPLIALAVLLGLTVGLFAVNFWMSISERQAELQRIEGEIQAVLSRVIPGKHSPAQGVRLLESKMRKLQQQGQDLLRFREYQYEGLGLLTDLSGLFKEFPQLTLRSVSMNPERYTISGTTSSYDDSENFKNRLAVLKRFSGKEPVITHQRAAEKINYRIVIER